MSFDVKLLQQFTDEHPTHIEASLENTSDQLVTAFGGATFPFGFYVGKHTERDASLLAIPFDREYLFTDPFNEAFVPSEPMDGCWTVDYDLGVNQIGIVGELTPGTVHRMEHTVLDDDNDACLPRGAYRFEYWLRLTPGGKRQRDRTESVTMTFSFTLVLGDTGAVSVEVNDPRAER